MRERPGGFNLLRPGRSPAARAPRRSPQSPPWRRIRPPAGHLLAHRRTRSSQAAAPTSASHRPADHHPDAGIAPPAGRPPPPASHPATPDRASGHLLAHRRTRSSQPATRRTRPPARRRASGRRPFTPSWPTLAAKPPPSTSQLLSRSHISRPRYAWMRGSSRYGRAGTVKCERSRSGRLTFHRFWRLAGVI